MSLVSENAAYLVKLDTILKDVNELTKNKVTKIVIDVNSYAHHQIALILVV